jgi:tetratricopeptide (TPR) repeat protein
MLARFLGLASFVLLAPAALAQGAAEHIALGDRETTAMNASAALAHYEQAVAAEPQNYEALWKAAREAIGLGEFEQDEAKRAEFFRKGEEYAQKAVEANPEDAEGHFNLARALGRRALSMGTRDRIKYAGVVREHALKALELNPQHPGALHVMGVWNAEVMRLNAISRAIAKNFLGGKVFGEANWANAVRYMEQAVAVDPQRLTHHLDLGKIYVDRGEKAKAREALERVVNGTATEYNDRFYKQEAQRALDRIK